MPVDLSRYLGLFVSEATDHLEALARDLVRLEREPTAEVVDSLFRHAHSVKGMSLSMGFEPIAALAHRVEDVVDAVRASPSVLDRPLVDLLLAAVDRMQSQVRAASAGAPPLADPQLLERLGVRLSQLRGSAVEAEPSEPPPPRPEAARRVEVRFQIAPTAQAPAVRAFLVQHRLSSLGTVENLQPPRELLRAGSVPDGRVVLELALHEDKDDDAVRALLAGIPELSSFEVGGEPSRRDDDEEEALFPGDGPSPTAAPEPPAKPIGHEPGRTVRVRAELLDHFLEMVGELLLATARIREVSRTVPEPSRPPLEEGVDRLHGLVKDLHDKVMGARMTPLSVVLDRLPRVARDVARRRGRDVELVLSGAETELDRAIVEELGDPLLHMLRNCIDHGIEDPDERLAAGKTAQGRVTIDVRRQRERVVVEMADDGRGMDGDALVKVAVARGLLTAEEASRLGPRDAFMLSCMPGVSTARDVSDISGRGVGMDAVKRAIENVGGTLEIDSERGKGTRFTLRLPLTVAVVKLLLVQVGDEVFGLPIAKVLGALEADEGQLWRRDGERVLAWGDGVLPVHALETLLELPASGSPPGPVRPYLVIEGESGRVALGVDRLLGQEEAVLKPLPRPLDRIFWLSGVTILGSGRPVFILDVPRLLV